MLDELVKDGTCSDVHVVGERACFCTIAMQLLTCTEVRVHVRYKVQ